MATDLEVATEAPPEQDDADFTLNAGGSAVLHGISWKMYRRLRKLSENRNLRMTYDQGELEIMSPSPLHEGIDRLLGRLIEVWTLVLNLPLRSCGRMTISRAALELGFEPDNCYYVQNEPLMWNKRKINFKTDPPPDLAIEVEVTRKLLNKTQIYAAFRVPELWRCNGTALKVLELSKDGEYVVRETSICFPGFPIAKAEEIVRQVAAAHETELVGSFQEWVRANIKRG
jgi:Uma2 family endonuclease